MDAKELLRKIGNPKKQKGLPARTKKRTKAGYYDRAFRRAAEHKKRNVARQARLAARNG